MKGDTLFNNRQRLAQVELTHVESEKGDIYQDVDSDVRAVGNGLGDAWKMRGFFLVRAKPRVIQRTLDLYVS